MTDRCIVTFQETITYAISVDSSDREEAIFLAAVEYYQEKISHFQSSVFKIITTEFFKEEESE